MKAMRESYTAQIVELNKHYAGGVCGRLFSYADCCKDTSDGKKLRKQMIDEFKQVCNHLPDGGNTAMDNVKSIKTATEVLLYVNSELTDEQLIQEWRSAKLAEITATKCSINVGEFMVSELTKITAGFGATGAVVSLFTFGVSAAVSGAAAATTAATILVLRGEISKFKRLLKKQRAELATKPSKENIAYIEKRLADIRAAFDIAVGTQRSKNISNL